MVIFATGKLSVPVHPCTQHLMVCLVWETLDGGRKVKRKLLNSMLTEGARDGHVGGVCALHVCVCQCLKRPMDIHTHTETHLEMHTHSLSFEMRLLPPKFFHLGSQKILLFHFTPTHRFPWLLGCRVGFHKIILRQDSCGPQAI